MEYESQVKLQKLIEQHRAELGTHNTENYYWSINLPLLTIFRYAMGEPNSSKKRSYKTG